MSSREDDAAAFVRIKADQNWAKKRRAGGQPGGAGSIGHAEEGGEEDDRRDHAAEAEAATAISSNDLFSSGRDPLGRF